jgi:site-specific DNA-cytosine methylase
MRKLIIFSAFDGISCIQEALHRAGITNYIIYASEIDPVAMRVTLNRYPKTKMVGDITKLRPVDFKNVDVIVGGSPCQSMSKMGKGRGITTKNGVVISTLQQYNSLKREAEMNGRDWNDIFNTSASYWEYVRMYRGIKKYNPNLYFLLENVANKLWESLITLSLGVDPIHINSNLVSAQNRDRNYWTNIPYTPIKDKHIYLNQVIHGAIAGVGIRGRKKKYEKHYTKYRTVRKDRKSNCLVTSPYMTGLYVSRDGKDRMFTHEQAEALQTLRVGYTDIPGITKTKRYALIGNAWTVDVLVNFLINLPKALKHSRKHKKSSVKL